MFNTPDEICVKFHYYMYGADRFNQLNLLAKRSETQEILWQKIGVQSNAWLEAAVSVSKPFGQSVEVSLSEHITIYLNHTRHEYAHKLNTRLRQKLS